MPTATIKANVIPADWYARSNDIQARLLRAGVHGTPVLDAPADAPWGAGPQLPLSSLLAVLHGADDVNAFLVETLNKRASFLDQALRTQAAVPTTPRPREAAVLLAALLSRAVGNAPTRAIPVDALRQLGAEGATVAQLLTGAIERYQQARAAHPSSTVDVRGMLEDVDSLTPWLEREALVRALTPVKAAAASDVNVDRMTTTLPPSRTRTRSADALKAVTLPDGIAARLPAARLLSVMSYGAGRALDIAQRELSGQPGLLDDRALGVAGAVARTRGVSSLSAALKAAARPGAAVDDPAVVMSALLRVLTSYESGGAIDWAAFIVDHGPVGAALAQRLLDAEALGEPARPNYPMLARVVEELRVSLPREQARPLIDAMVRDSGLIPKQLAVLDRLKTDVPADALTGRGMVAVQHLFPTTVPLIEALIEKGMKPADIYILGTPYASNPLVASYLRSLGVHVMEGSDKGGSTRAFEEHRIGEVHAFLSEVTRAGKSPPNGWKLLDDGGMLQTIIAGQKATPPGGVPASTLRALFDPQHTDAIEQTTRGLTELKKQPIQYKTVALASAAPKQREGDVVGYALAEALVLESAQTDRLGDTVRVGVVSAGTIGLATAKQLRSAGFNVEMVDIDDKKRALAEGAGFPAHASVDDISGHTDVLLSCTGKTALRGDMLGDFHGALMSGSSAAIEFDAEQIDSHRSERITVMNRGRPANFRGDGYENLTAENIALTRALLFIGVTQDLSKEAAPGLIDLDHARGALAEQTWDARGGPNVPNLSRTAPPTTTTTTTTRRPDTLSGTARHDEWMAYLARLPRSVCPPPNEVGERPGVFIFTGDDGETRIVDTRGPAPGASMPVDLPRVPRMLTALRSPDADGWMAEGADENGRFFAMLGRNGDHIDVKSVLRADRCVIAASAVDPGVHPSWGVREATRLVLEAGDKLLFTFPGSTDVHTLQRQTTGDALYFAAQEHVFLEVQKKPPRVVVHDPMGGGVVSRFFAGASLPTSMTEIEALVQLPGWQNPLLVGRDAQGALLAQRLVGSAEAIPVRLPAGAVFRGVHRPDPTKPFDVVLDYTLPGDAVELEALRHAPIQVR